MAITIEGLKTFLGARGAAREAAEARADHTTLIMQRVRAQAQARPGRNWGVGHWPFARQYTVALATLGAGLVLAVGFTVYGAIQLGQRAAYESHAATLKVLSQRLPMAAQHAVSGRAEAFATLAEGRDAFVSTLEGLERGDGQVPATSGEAATHLAEVRTQWDAMNPRIGLILEQKQNLVTLGENIRRINALSAELQKVAEELAATLAGAPADLARATQLVVLSQRLPKNANLLLSASTVEVDTVRQMEQDAILFRNAVQGLLAGSLGRSESGLARLEQVAANMAEMVEVIGSVVATQQPLMAAKEAAGQLFGSSDALLSRTEALAAAYRTVGSGGYAAAAVFGLVALAALIWLGQISIQQTRARAQASEQENARNQEAILRLMDELGALAEGDLTVNASVTEDITGAIADSINYTVEELRTLVRGINTAAVRMDEAAGEAGKISDALQAAVRRQVAEIEATSATVVELAQSVQAVSGNAAECAQVAGQSLSAAEKGQQAVTQTIEAMNALREQIQETAKRIKRLGESSQEIGEIVELISDITEQTNVLALNAAIQAAAAGEAGRGFSVVAEEVQRLAERSADATRQIAVIVKTIQSDTQDTVSAMETSTQSVIEGARRSDTAGQALAEIGQVSRRLAELIADISAATQQQAESTARVAESMHGIMAVSAQTASGTQITAASIEDMKSLVESLKNSVSGFKLA